MTTLIFANTALVIDHRSFLLSYLSQVKEFLNNLFGFALLKKMYFKLISEEIGFNFMENVIQFLTSQKKSDVAIIPLENNMAALRKGQFDVTSNLLGIWKGFLLKFLDLKSTSRMSPLGLSEICGSMVHSLMSLFLISRLMGALSLVSVCTMFFRIAWLKIPVLIL